MRSALVLLAGVGAAGFAVAVVGLAGDRPAARGPISLPNPVGNGVERLLPDTVPPGRAATLLWLEGRVAQPTEEGAVVLDGAGGVLSVDARLQVRRVRVQLEGREPASVAPAPDGGFWVADAGGAVLRSDRNGRVIQSRHTAFSFPAVAGDRSGRDVWLVRSAERFAYNLPSPNTPLMIRLGAAGRDSTTVGKALQPAHVLLADLANAGHVAVGDGMLYYTPFIRDEVIALTPAGDTAWVARRDLPQTTRDPRFEVQGKRVVVDYHPVNLGIALGPDRRLYVLSTAGFTTTEGRLDVFDPVGGRLLRSTLLPTALPTIAVDEEGRVYLLDPFRLLTGVSPAEREPIPAFDLPLLRGGRLSSTALRGRVVLLNFWASWCTPCRTEMPALDSLRREITDTGFLFLGMNEENDITAARAFLEEFGFGFPVALGRGGLRERFHYPGLPYTVLVDRAGRIVNRWIGFAGPEQLQAIAALTRAELDRSARHAHPSHEVSADVPVGRLQSSAFLSDTAP
ncbi:MAG: redoxin family protein [Gemmatimonadales bacterium]